MDPVVVTEDLVPSTVVIVGGTMWQLSLVLEERGYRGLAFNLEDRAQILQTDVLMYRFADAWTGIIHKVAVHHGIRKNAGLEIKESRAFGLLHGRDASRW